MNSTERDLPESRLAIFAAKLNAADWTSALLAAYNPTGASEVSYETAKAALVADLVALASIRAERDAAVADAERWRALMASPRLHFMGSAGFEITGPRGKDGVTIATAVATAKPTEQLHFGMEFWSDFEWRSPEEAAKYPDTFERAFMVTYVDEMRRRAARAIAGEPTNDA